MVRSHMQWKYHFFTQKVQNSKQIKENYFISEQEKFPDIIKIAAKWTQNIEYVGVGSMRRTTGTG